MDAMNDNLPALRDEHKAWAEWFRSPEGQPPYGDEKFDVSWHAWKARAASRDAEVQRLRDALAELVALEDLKKAELRLRQRRIVSIERDVAATFECDVMREDGNRRRPLAWAAARAALAQQAPASHADAPIRRTADALYDAIKTTLEHHRLSHQVDSQDEAYPLIDALTPAGQTIAVGRDEIVFICDAIYNEVLAVAPPASTGDAP